MHAALALVEDASKLVVEVLSGLLLVSLEHFAFMLSRLILIRGLFIGDSRGMTPEQDLT